MTRILAATLFAVCISAFPATALGETAKQPVRAIAVQQVIQKFGYMSRLRLASSAVVPLELAAEKDQYVSVCTALVALENQTKVGNGDWKQVGSPIAPAWFASSDANLCAFLRSAFEKKQKITIVGFTGKLGLAKPAYEWDSTYYPAAAAAWVEAP